MHNWEPITESILSAQKILIFTHMNMDGDAAGSSCALCRSFRQMGKESYILVEDKCADYLQFLDCGMFTKKAPWEPDLCLAVDCSDDSRIEKRKDVFHGAPVTACIDHHMSGEPFADVSVVDPKAPAAGSLVFEFLRAMNAPIDKEIAEALYVAIATDTGSFRHGNSTPEALRNAADLYDYGIDAVDLNNRIYSSYPLPQLKLEALAVDRAELFAGGKAVLSWSTPEDLKRLGALEEHTECCIDRLRSIAGVEVAAFLKERADGSIKVSFRSKSYADVNTVARKFDGGGHLRASGCTLHCSLEEAKAVIRAALEESLT